MKALCQVGTRAARAGCLFEAAWHRAPGQWLAQCASEFCECPPLLSAAGASRFVQSLSLSDAVLTVFSSPTLTLPLRSLLVSRTPPPRACTLACPASIMYATSTR
eukprot:6173775-Pleurochrysis_carterae.AAC.6